MLAKWGANIRCKTEQNRCIAGAILGRFFEIHELMFNRWANGSVKFEFANDSKCANFFPETPSLLSTIRAYTIPTDHNCESWLKHP